jgi:hypothetical protein
MEAFSDGAESSDALRAATGLDFGEFQQAWWDWLGGAPGAHPTPLSLAIPDADASPESAATLVPPSVTPRLEQAQADPTSEAGRASWWCVAGAADMLAGLTAVLPGLRVGRGRAAGRRRGRPDPLAIADHPIAGHAPKGDDTR